MTLRRRLVFTLLAAAVPLAGALVLVRIQLMQRASQEMARGFIEASLSEGGRELCEADPVAFGESGGRRRLSSRSGDHPPGDHPPEEPPRRPPTDARRPPSRGDDHRGGRPHFRPRLYAFDATYHAADPSAPALPEPVRLALERDAELASERREDGTLLVAARMSWNEGPCAIIAIVSPTWWRPLPPADQLTSWGILGAGLVLAAWLSAGPVVKRIHLLTDDVRRSAAGQYADSVRVLGSDEITGLARAFNDAAGQVRSHIVSIQDREETLRAFLANTTHDVMLPLTVLQGHLARLKELGREPDVAQTVTAAAEEADYMGSLLQNLTAAAKLETGAPLIEQHDVDLGGIVERVVHRHARLASARRVEIGHAVPEAPVHVQGDVTLLEQAVGNLVQNAVRHNVEGGHVAVVLDADGPDGFILRVADDGPGVAPADLPRLGERRFRTEEARQRHPEGLGVGLSIVRSVAERHGFALAFSASEPSGLTVELRGGARRQENS
jgi:signal transduction histidine kinase